MNEEFNEIEDYATRKVLNQVIKDHKREKWNIEELRDTEIDFEVNFGRDNACCKGCRAF